MVALIVGTSFAVPMVAGRYILLNYVHETRNADESRRKMLRGDLSAWDW